MARWTTDWDPKKDQQNRRKHGLSFDEMLGFDWDTALFVGEDVVDHEVRHLVVGRADLKIVVAVVAHRGDIVRVISLRKATRREERMWSEE